MTDTDTDFYETLDRGEEAIRLRRQAAKIAYDAYCHRALSCGSAPAFELLPPREMQAWMDVAKALREAIEDEAPIDDAICSDCGKHMECPVCD